MPLKLFNKGDVEPAPSQRPPIRRLSKPKPMSNSSRSPQKQNDSPQSARDSWIMEDDAVVETSGSHRSRPSTRSRIRSQLFSEKFNESNVSQLYVDEEHAENNKRRSLGEGAPNRLSLPPRAPTALPDMSSPEGSKVSLSLDTEIDLPRAISIIQELKKNASPEDLVLLHKALLPTKDENSPVSANSDELPSPLIGQPTGRTIRRRSMQQAPGVATRLSPRPSPMVSRSDERIVSQPLAQSSQKRTEPRRTSFPLSTPSYGQIDSGHSKMDMSHSRQTNDDRAATLSSQTDYGSLSTPGELRVTNGAASPDSMRSIRKMQHVQRAELVAQKIATPSLHSREESLPKSSLQQMIRQDDDSAPESLQVPRQRTRLLRDEKYFTALEYPVNSKEETRHAKDESETSSQTTRNKADIASLPSQSKPNVSSSTRPSEGEVAHHQTKSGNPYTMKILDNVKDEAGRTDDAHDHGPSLSLKQSFWLESPKAEDYRREIQSNPYILSDDSRTPTPQPSPPQDAVGRPKMKDGHKRQQSRTPAEALQQLSGSPDTEAELGIDSPTLGREDATFSTVTIIQPQSVQKCEEKPRQIEIRKKSEEEPRTSESSFKKDSGYNSAASSTCQSQQTLQSKHSNPKAPRPVEGGTFGKSSFSLCLRPDLIPSDSLPSSDQGNNAGEVTLIGSESYQVRITSVPQVPPSKSKSSLKLIPSTWFSRSSSTPPKPPHNDSVESFMTSNENLHDSRKPKKLQKSRRKSAALLIPSKEDVSLQPSSEGCTDALSGSNIISKSFSISGGSQTMRKDEFPQRAGKFIEQNTSREAVSQDRETDSNKRSKEAFVTRSKSLGAQSKSGDIGTSTSSRPIPDERKVSRRKSIFRRGSSSIGTQARDDSSSLPSDRKSASGRDDEREDSESDGDGFDQDFGTVAGCLGGSPYDIAMSGEHVQKAAWNSASDVDHSSFPSHSHQAQQLMGQAMQPVGVPHPHQISNAHVRRPKSLISMNEQQASEFARLRSRDRAEMHGKPRSVDPRNISISSGPARPKSFTESLLKKPRPESLYETYPGAPPVPALPQMATSDARLAEGKSSEEKVLRLPQSGDAKILSSSQPIEESQLPGRPEKENHQKLQKERRKSFRRDKAQEQSQPPSPIREEEGSPKLLYTKVQTNRGEDLKRKSLGAIRGTLNSRQEPKNAATRNSHGDVAPQNSPTQALEARLNNLPSQMTAYHASFHEHSGAKLSKEAEQGLQVYPEFAHLLRARASAKGKAPEGMSEYHSSNTTIDTIITSPPIISVSPAARAAHSKLSPLNASHTPDLQQQKDGTLPMPRRHIHPSARPRQATNNLATSSPSQVRATPLFSPVPHPASDDVAAAADPPPRPTTASEPTPQPRLRPGRPQTAAGNNPRPTSIGSGPPDSSSSGASALSTIRHAELLNRYSGGLHYGWERGVGIGGSAGTREEGNRASWKGIQDRMSWGLDFGDVPVFVTGK